MLTSSTLPMVDDSDIPTNAMMCDSARLEKAAPLDWWETDGLQFDGLGLA